MDSIAGDACWIAGGSAAILKGKAAPLQAVRTKAWVSRPYAPGTMRAGRAATIHGYLKPLHKAGSSPVRIYRYRKTSSGWKPYGFVSAVASDYTKDGSTYTRYSASVKLPYTGEWRLRAYHPEDAAHLATWSSTHDTVIVTK